MGITTRQFGPYAKGSRLTTAEMDENFNYLNSWDKSMEGGHVTYVPLTKDGKTQTEILNEAFDAASAGDTLILASGTYTVSSTIIIDKSITVLGQAMDATTITSSVNLSDTLDITASNVTLANITINNTGHDSTAVFIHPTNSGDPNLTGVTIENITINSLVADGANLGILANNSNVDIHDCQITVTTVNTSSAGISLYIDPNATADIRCFMSGNTIQVYGATSVVPPAVFGNEGIRIFCSLNTVYTLNVDMYNVDSRATTVGASADYGIRVTSATGAGVAYKAIVNSYNCVFGGTTKDVRVFGTGVGTTNTLNLHGCTLLNGTPQGIGGASGAPGVAVNNSGIIAAKGIQVADNAATASAFNVGTMRYRVSGNNSYCEMVMQTAASTYEWTIVKTNAW
jgi:hypothetical protein